MASLPAFDPTPRAIEDFARSLPPTARASIEWFPSALRRTFVEPLRAASPAAFRPMVEEATVEAVRVVVRLLAGLAEVIKLVGDFPFHDDEDRERARHDRIAARIEPLDRGASDALRSSYEWMRAVLQATNIRLRDELANDPDLPEGISGVTDAEIRDWLAGESGSFMRGLLLTIGALELVLEDRPLPATMGQWCRLALTEMHAAANALRSTGIPLPTEVRIPGFSAAAWRERSESLPRQHGGGLLFLRPRHGPCPPGVIERIVEVLSPEEIWLFGSRAHGTARTESDWDLLVVVPDSTERPLDRGSLWADLHDLHRTRVDVFPIRRSEFDADRECLGTLAHIASSEGYVVYAR